MWSRALVLLGLTVLATAGCANEAPNSGDEVTQEQGVAALPTQQRDRVEEIRTISRRAIQPPDSRVVERIKISEGLLRGPHYSMRVNWVATTRWINNDRQLEQVGNVTPRRAEDGQEIVIAAFDPEVVGGDWLRVKQPKPAAELVVDGKATPLQQVPLTAQSRGALPEPAVLVIASVRIGAPVMLTVKDVDRVQTLDVRTGKRASDEIPIYYQPNYRKLDFDEHVAYGIRAGGARYSGGLKVTSKWSSDQSQNRAMLTPWTPDIGWAAPGRAWLRLPQPGLVYDFSSTSPPLILTIDLAKVFRIQLPDGTHISARGGMREIDTIVKPTDPFDLTFDVPAGLTTATYQIDLSTASITAEFTDGKLAARWLQAPPAVEIPISLT